ncbi:MAG: HEAT repeat domain-containing protein [Planctomycetota bacterium]
MTRLFLPLALLLLAPGGLAEDGEAPLPFFRTPDKATRKVIVHTVSAKGLGSGTRRVRQRSRRELVEIGPWAVPFLAEALTRRTENMRVRMNAAITLAWIQDRHGIAALNTGAEEDKDLYVRRTSCLALGKFRESGALVRVLRTRRRGATKTAAALALAKSTDLLVAGTEIKAAAANMPKDPHFAAALLVATALLEDDPQIVDRFLGHKEKLLRRAAVTCRLIRPLKPTQAELLVKRLAIERDREIRALLYHALGAVEGAEDLQKRLLEAATQTKEKKPARIAAALELARRYNVRANYASLWKALRKIQSRNDPVVGALVFALAQTGAPEAREKLRKIMWAPEAGLRSFYAAGSLLYVACSGQLKEAEAKVIMKDIADTPSKEPWLRELVKIATWLPWKDPAVWWEMALAGDKENNRKGLKDLRAARIWTVSHEDRAWAKLNLLLPYIFELDDIMDTRDMSEHAPTEPPKGQGATDDAGGGDDGTHDDGTGDGDEGGIQPAVGNRAASGKADEQDLIDFLKDPYFVREDLRGG